MTDRLHASKASGLFHVLLMLVLPTQIFYPVAASWLIGLTLLLGLFLGWRPWFGFIGPDALPRILAAALWLMCLLRLPFSEHPDIAGRSIETKLPLLFLPSLFAFGFIAFDAKKKQILFVCLFVAATLCSLLNFLLSLKEFNAELFCRANGIVLMDYPHWNVFFASRLSHFMHPGYFSVYLLTGLLAIWQFSLKSWNFTLLPLLLLGFTVVFLSSKTAYILSFLLLLYCFVFRNKQTHARLINYALLVLFIATAMLAVQMPWIRSSVQEVFQSGSDHGEHSTSMRLASWESSMRIMMINNGLGAGPGDTEFAYETEYIRHGLPVAAEKKLNAHNQILQSAAMFGIPGLLINAALLLLILIRGWNSREQPNMAFLALAIFVFSSTEAILETQAGVIWFCFSLSVVFPYCRTSRLQASDGVVQK